MFDNSKALESAQELVNRELKREAESIKTDNPTQDFQRKGKVNPPSDSDYHQGLVEVSNRQTGASWFTMKFVREKDAVAYAEKRKRESDAFEYDVIRKKVTDAKVKELCEIPGFLKR